jgi:hypothetical protein
LAKIQKLRSLTDQKVLTLQPEDLPACYPVVLVAPYRDAPQSTLRFWTNDASTWRLGDTCASN